MTDYLGENLSGHSLISYIEAESLDELQFKLRAIKVPYSIKSIYRNGNRHVAWVDLSLKVGWVEKKDAPKDPIDQEFDKVDQTETSTGKRGRRRSR